MKRPPEQEEHDSTEPLTATETVAAEGTGDEVARPAKQQRAQHQKKHKQPRLKWGLRRGPITGLRGVLVTCAVGREQRCAAEIAPFLDSVAAELLGEEDTDDAVQAAEAAASTADEAKEVTLEDMLAAERDAMAARVGTGSTERVQAMYSGVNGVIFVRVMRDELSPTALCRAAAELATRPDCPVRLRQTVRVVPLEKTCQVSAADITHTIAPLLLKAFVTDVAPASAQDKPQEGAEPAPATKVKRAGVTYHVEFRARNCSAVRRQDGINAVLHAMPDAAKCASAGVCEPVLQFKGSDVAVIVELFKSTCGVAVAPDFDRFHQYNLRALQDAAAASAAHPVAEEERAEQ